MSDLIPIHLDHMRAVGRSPATIRLRASVLRRLHNALHMGLAYASSDEIEQWIAQLPSRSAKATYGSQIRAFYRWATVIAELLDGDPTQRLERAKAPKLLPKPVDDDELAAALALHHPRWLRTAILLAAYAGLRCKEIAETRREDVTQQRIYVNGKGDVDGIVYTHPLIWEEVKHRSPGLLVTNRHGTCSAQWLSAAAAEQFDRAGLRIRMHKLRHWYGTTIHAQLGDALVTQRCLRHESPSSTVGYVKVAETRLAGAVHALPVLGEAGAPAGPGPIVAPGP